MRLAEALILRADSQKRIEQLRERLTRSAKVQEGEQPPENPEDLIRDLERASNALLDLIRKFGLEDRLHLWGARAGARLDARYSAADLMVLAYYSETYVMSVTDSLARGISVLATDVVFVSE